MKRVLYTLNPVLFIIGILLCLLDIARIFSFSVCLDCGELDGVRQAVVNFVRGGWIILLTLAVIISIFKRRDAQKAKPGAFESG